MSPLSDLCAACWSVIVVFGATTAWLVRANARAGK